MPQADPQSTPSATILVVDDDQDTRDFLVMLVGLAGYRTLEAATGAAAIAAVVTQPVAAVLLDLRLPDTDGLAVCRQLRANGHADVPIILMTADRMPGVERQAAAAGVTSFLAKPFTPDELLDRLKVELAVSPYAVSQQ